MKYGPLSGAPARRPSCSHMRARAIATTSRLGGRSSKPCSATSAHSCRSVIEPENDHGLADRLHLARQVVEARVDAAEHAIGHRHVLRHETLDVVDRHVVLAELGEEAQRRDLVRRHALRLERLRVLQEVTLEAVEAERDAVLELLHGLDLLGDELEPAALELTHGALQLRRILARAIGSFTMSATSSSLRSLWRTE